MGAGLGSLAGSCETPLSPTEMLSDSEEEPVSSNSYDYSESGLCAQLGWGTRAGLGVEGWREGAIEGPGMRFRSSPISHCITAKPGPGLFLLPEGWEDQGAGRGSPGR